MKDYQRRVVDEKADLELKYRKLSAFIESSKDFKMLPEFDRTLLKNQAQTMTTYIAILAARIIRFN